MTYTPKIAVVIVTYDSENHIDDLLDSLPAAMGRLVYSTVVVDNGSQDATLDQLGSVRLLGRRICQRRVPAGVNRGVRASNPADAILIVNPDAILDSGSIEQLHSVMRRTRGIGIVVPRLREPDGELFPSLRRAPTLLRGLGLSFVGRPAFVERIVTLADYDREQVVDWATGAVMLINAACYRDLGGFESYFLYSEETDFCLRASDSGWSTVYTPRAGATHVGGGCPASSARTRTMRIVNRVRLYRRRSGPIRGVRSTSRARSWRTPPRCFRKSGLSDDSRRSHCSVEATGEAFPRLIR